MTQHENIGRDGGEPLSPHELRSLARRSRQSRRGLADADTPFITNMWYVALRADELGPHLTRRVLLDIPVVLYRTTTGEPVALQDRCGHRSFPLSKSDLVDDTIVCRYHGLRYNRRGLCIEIPGQAAVRGRFGIRAFPVVERGPFIWIWPGDPELADPALVPVQPWLESAGWDVQIGYAHVRGNYVHLHENLLDLSHLTFLHAKSFGTPEYARAPVEMKIEPDNIEAWRHVECVLPDLYAKALGWEGERAMRRSGSQLVSPGLHVNTGIFENLERAMQPVPTPMVKVSQIITPETKDATHYYYALCRNFSLDDPTVGPTMLRGLSGAFAEDAFALESIADQPAPVEPAPALEFDIPTDRAGLEMRRRFHRLAMAEAAALPA